MGYDVVVSLKQTLLRLLHSSLFSVDSRNQESLEIAYKHATCLQEVLIKTMDNRGGGGGKRLHTLEGRVREAVHRLEDHLELHQSYVFLDEDNLSINPEQLKEEINRFAEKAKELMEEDCVEESEEDDADADADAGASATASASNTGFGEEMVGLSDELTYMKIHVRSVLRPDDCGVFSIVGTAGTGRSLVAKKVFDDVRSSRELGFKDCMWVSVGPIYRPKKILHLILTQLLTTEKMAVLNQLLTTDNNGWGDLEIAILRQVLSTDNEGGAEKVSLLSGLLKTNQGWGDEETRKKCLWWRLAWRKYMIVLDDVCDARILDLLLPILPLQNNGSTVMVTTASVSIGKHANHFAIYRMEDIHNDMYWDIFRLVLFRLQPIPPALEEAGRKIAWNCRGRCLCVSKVFLYLWSVDRSPETWNEIACNPHHPLFNIVDELSEIEKIEDDFANLTTEPAEAKAILSPFVLDNGISVDVEFIKEKLFPERFFPKMEVISFVGMAGIGKTTFVRKIFASLQNLDGFEPRPRFCVWVTLGPKYESEDILMDILAQVFPRINKKQMKGDAELTKNLCRRSSNLRFLIVLDDVWNEAPLRNLAKLFPNIKGRILLTTRIAQVAKSKMIDITREVRFLSKEESWDLLRQKVFVEGRLYCFELEKAGKKIAENCDGLPLTILKVANLISKNLSPQYWSDVANKNSDFMDALEELSEVLLPCYDSLPLYLRPCFLYMGVFPQNHEVSTSKVLKLWIAEGFLESDSFQKVQDFAKQCLLELVNRNLVMVCYKGSSSYGVESCRLNSIFWHLCNREAVKINFFHACDLVQGEKNLKTKSVQIWDSIQVVKNQRRFCIRNCILLGIKKTHESMMKSTATARSLVCTGPYHHYQVPVNFQMMLLRVVDALVIRFYEFPVEVVKLIHLRHLAITCDGNLPTSISKLWNLQFLIVNRHLRINSSGDSSSYLPMEIWDMKELRHLQVTGSSLPTPSRGTTLPNLVTLLEVSSHSCTEKVLDSIPNLEKLGIGIVLAPGDVPSLHHLNHITNSLNKLKSIKCVVVNPEIGFEVVVPPPPVSMFPSSVVKLSLSGLGYPWEYMDPIGKLENLQVLKLQYYAFRGEKWETGDNAFENLVHLVIEDTDLVCWKTSILSFSKLSHLSIKHCYNLEIIPYYLVRNKTIEVVDCNPLAVKWANYQLKEMYGFHAIPAPTDRVLETLVESSWDDGQP